MSSTQTVANPACHHLPPQVLKSVCEWLNGLTVGCCYPQPAYKPPFDSSLQQFLPLLSVSKALRAAVSDVVRTVRFPYLSGNELHQQVCSAGARSTTYFRNLQCLRLSSRPNAKTDGVDSGWDESALLSILNNCPILRMINFNYRINSDFPRAIAWILQHK